ncbi:aldose 1-epimerase family protein, partial [Enterococcus faecalis]|nr:aldose 1-epimerase family protein [Enterococcus faecalis]
IPLAGPFIDLANKTLAQTNTSFDLTHQLFENDAMIFETKGQTAITIATDESEHQVTLSYPEMPFVGIWSPTPKEAPFVCIEPWCGIADAVDATGQLAEKFGINKLPANELFKTQYMISVK